MILVDTNIIIDFWRTQNRKYERVFRYNNVYICGIVKAELYHGARNLKDLKRIKSAVSEFPELQIPNSIWGLMGENLFKLKTNGLTLPIQDVLIATLALENDFQVWSNDKHFQFIKDILPSLKLFSIENNK